MSSLTIPMRGFAMIAISCPYGSLDRFQVKNLVNKLEGAMSCITKEKNTFAIYADSSVSGVLLTLASINLRQRTAICPLREPALVQKEWLNNLGVVDLFSSLNNSEVSSVFDQYYFVDEMLQNQRHRDQNDDGAKNFSSIIRTSGTTSWPKSALISEQAYVASAKSVNDFFSFDHSSVWALTLPLYHVSGLSIIFRCLAANASLYVARTYEDLLIGLKQKKITHLSLVPAQLKRLLDDDVDPSGVIALIIGGDELPKYLREQALKKGWPLYSTYGLTETASMIWVCDATNACARLLPHATMKITDDGEILVGGQSLFDGYLGSNGELERNLISDFFLTGDLGKMQGDQLHIIGRTHNRIISGGENIQAEEVERAIETHPMVEASVVVGLFDLHFGMRPCAIIRWKTKKISSDDLLSYLSPYLARHKLPQIILTWPPNAPHALKKPRKWLQEWANAEKIFDSSVIVGA